MKGSELKHLLALPAQRYQLVALMRATTQKHTSCTHAQNKYRNTPLTLLLPKIYIPHILSCHCVVARKQRSHAMMHLTDTLFWVIACKSSVVVAGNAQSHVLGTVAASQAAAPQRVMAHGVQPETHSGAQQTGAYSEAYLPSRLSQETNGHSQGLTHPRYSPT